MTLKNLCRELKLTPTHNDIVVYKTGRSWDYYDHDLTCGYPRDYAETIRKIEETDPQAFVTDALVVESLDATHLAHFIRYSHDLPDRIICKDYYTPDFLICTSLKITFFMKKWSSLYNIQQALSDNISEFSDKIHEITQKTLAN